MFVLSSVVVSGALVVYMWRSECIEGCKLSKKWILMVAMVLLSGLIWLLTERKFGGGLMAMIYFELTVLLMVFGFIDALSMKVPVDLLVAAGVIGMVAMFLNPNLIWYENILTVLAAGLVLYGVVRLSRGSIGEGDVLLLGVIVLYMGWEHGLLIFLSGLVLSGITGIILLLTGRVSRKTVLPFVPFMAVVQVGLLLV